MAAGLMIEVGSYFNVQNRQDHLDSGTTITAGDIVTLTSGKLALVGTPTFAVGVTKQSGTSATNNVAVNTTPGLIVIMDSDSSGTPVAATNVGNRYNVSGNTGAMIVSTTTANTSATNPSGLLAFLEYNPRGYGYDSTTTVGKFAIAQNLFGFSR